MVQTSAHLHIAAEEGGHHTAAEGLRQEELQAAAVKGQQSGSHHTEEQLHIAEVLHRQVGHHKVEGHRREGGRHREGGRRRGSEVPHSHRRGDLRWQSSS